MEAYKTSTLNEQLKNTSEKRIEQFEENHPASGKNDANMPFNQDSKATQEYNPTANNMSTPLCPCNGTYIALQLLMKLNTTTAAQWFAEGTAPAMFRTVPHLLRN